MDITSLYTVIPNDEGLLALKHFFDLRTVKEPSSETLLRLAELVLTLNCFSFADSYFKQINGVAMGTNKRGYPASVVEAGHHRVQQIDRQSALQMSQRDNNDRIPFILTFHPQAESFRNLH